MNAKRKKIIDYLNSIAPEGATIGEICKNVDIHYYTNAEFHLGNILRRMVKDRQIKKVKRGVYAAGMSSAPEQQTLFEDPAQTKLF